MCFGGSQPKAPKVEYVGPSEEDIERQQESLAEYESQIADQQSAFQAQLQKQIDNANAETEALKTQYAADLTAAKQAGNAAVGSAKGDAAAAAAAAGADATAQQVGALTVTTTQSEPEQEQVTETIKKKKKPKSNLKISTAGTASGTGSGLNIGV